MVRLRHHSHIALRVILANSHLPPHPHLQQQFLDPAPKSATLSVILISIEILNILKLISFKILGGRKWYILLVLLNLYGLP